MAQPPSQSKATTSKAATSKSATSKTAPSSAASKAMSSKAAPKKAAAKTTKTAAKKPAPKTVQKTGQAGKRPNNIALFATCIIGGLLAGGIGFGAATYLAQAQNTALEARLSALEAQEQIDLAPLTNDLNRLETRLAELENRPLSESVNSGLERDLETLRQNLAEQRAALGQVAQQATDQIQSLQQEATALIEQARQTEQGTLIRGAMDQINAALESGATYGDAIRTLDDHGVTVPDALQQQAMTGVPTLAALQGEFDALSRAALKTARDVVGPPEGENRITAFFKAQLGMRSLTPQEGNSPDAILSRATAAVQNGDLQTALDEIATLPAEAQEDMKEWITQAQNRLLAQTALDALKNQ